MAHQHKGLESSGEAAAQQSKFSQSYSKNNQHTEQCVFGERACEPSSRRHLKYILMEWYIYRNEGNGLPDIWNCPLLNCEQQCSTFAGVITHLEKCPHLKNSTRQYTCPACQQDVRMPARGHGEKAMLKLKRSLLSYPSSPARSSSSGSSLLSPLSSESGLSQESDQVSPVTYSCGSSQVNAQATNPSSQHNRIFDVDPIVTQFNSTLTYATGAYNNNSYPSSTTTHSSGESGLNGAFSPQGIPSAVSLPTQLTWSPSNVAWIHKPPIDISNTSQWTDMPQQPCSLQHVGDLTYMHPLPELSEANLLQETAEMEDMTFLLTGSGDTNMNYSKVQEELQSECTSFLQNKWIQRGGFSSDMPESVINSPEENGVALEVPDSIDPVHESFFPVYGDVIMVDTPPTSEGPLAATNSWIPKCNICEWEPDTSVKRSLQKLAAAVKKHIKRKHNGEDAQCPFCDQVLKGRSDNLKPHVVRKHPEKLASLYPTKEVLDSLQNEKPTTMARVGPKRRASMPHCGSAPSPARGKHIRFKR